MCAAAGRDAMSAGGGQDLGEEAPGQAACDCRSGRLSSLSTVVPRDAPRLGTASSMSSTSEEAEEDASVKCHIVVHNTFLTLVPSELAVDRRRSLSVPCDRRAPSS